MKGKLYPLMGLVVLSLLFYGTVSFSQEIGPSPVAARWDMVRASDMLGVDLRSIDGQVYLARIDDLGINPSTGSVDYLIINNVRRMGMTKEYAIPFKYVERYGATKYVFNPPEPVQEFRSYSQGVFTEDDDFVVYLNHLPAMPADYVKYSDILGGRIQIASASARDAGYINDAVINLSDGHIVYLVLSDVSGERGKMTAIPFGAFTWNGEKVFVLHMTEDRLVSAPAFTWNDMGDQGYITEIYLYYGVQPYWEAR